MTAKELVNVWRNRVLAYDIGKYPNMEAAIAIKQCASELEKEMENPTDFLCPDESLKGKIPLVLYFETRKEVDDFISLVQEAKSNLVAKPL